MYVSLIGISRGMGGLRKNPFNGGGMDIFWNYTIENRIDLRKQLHYMWSVEVGNITREALRQEKPQEKL